MARPAARQTTGVPQAPAAAQPAPPTEAPKPAALSPGWRVALFIWAAAFVGLVAYELLTTLVRSLGR